MPFITQEHRDNPDFNVPGDRCYFYYRQMMDQWSKERRWTTFDKMAESLWPDPDERAKFLALLVFFVWNVADYEQEKEEENGEIK